MKTVPVPKIPIVLILVLLASLIGTTSLLVISKSRQGPKPQEATKSQPTPTPSKINNVPDVRDLNISFKLPTGWYSTVRNFARDDNSVTYFSNFLPDICDGETADALCVCDDEFGGTTSCFSNMPENSISGEMYFANACEEIEFLQKTGRMSPGVKCDDTLTKGKLIAEMESYFPENMHSGECIPVTDTLKPQLVKVGGLDAVLSTQKAYCAWEGASTSTKSAVYIVPVDSPVKNFLIIEWRYDELEKQTNPEVVKFQKMIDGLRIYKGLTYF